MFTKTTQPATPRRRWSLVGFPGSGKSTFAARMRGPLLAIDADHRFDEVLPLASEVYQLSASPSDNVQTERIVDCLHANMAGSPVRTIVVDSADGDHGPAGDPGHHRQRRRPQQEPHVLHSRKRRSLCGCLQDAVSAWGMRRPVDLPPAERP